MAEPPENPDKKRRGLGRGLSALFEDEEPYPATPDSGDDTPAPKGVRKTLNIAQIEPNATQPRQFFDEDALKELAESIGRHGVLQPLVVRQKDGFPDQYQIVAGERRWRACQIAQVHEIPVVIQSLNDEEVLEIALVENLQREDLNPLEEAEGYRNLIDRFGHSQEEVAAYVGKSRSHVANQVRLLTLPPGVRGLVRDGKLSAGHARALVTAHNPDALAKKIVEEGLSVRQTEALAGAELGRKPKDKTDSPGKATSAKKDADTLALEREVSNALGMKVSISLKNGTSGTLSVEFQNLEQLDEILHRLSHYPGSKVSG
ncbi:MAG: ParB/RepB/Spo0J family partition protein [Rhodospirillales bacterium]|nr:ParB/RepB/Spo0J family partition protein [Rhodospirillales bacterium]